MDAPSCLVTSNLFSTSLLEEKTGRIDELRLEVLAQRRALEEEKHSRQTLLQKSQKENEVGLSKATISASHLKTGPRATAL